MKARTRILGVGSPFGDDRLGWIAVDLIRDSAWYRSRAAGSLSAQAFDRPGPALLAAMDGAAHAVLIDAMQSGAAPGTVRGDLALGITPNLVHASDSLESAARELALYFTAEEYLAYSRVGEEYF